MMAAIIRSLRSGCYQNLPGMITCVEFEDFILDYLEGSLPKRQRIIFEIHLAVCRECRDYLTAYKKTIELGKRIFEGTNASVPESVPEDLIAAVLAARSSAE